MLPSSPRVQGGLPSGPRASAPRSRSIGPSRQQNARRHSEDEPLPSRQIRPQKSQASFPREPSRSRQALSSSSESSGGWQRRHAPSKSYSDTRAETPSLSSRSSQDSTASSVSSLFERVKNGAASYASSFTSVEDSGNDGEYEDTRGRSWRKQRSYSPEPQTVRTDTGTGDGYTVWSRVASAANSLTISVSKAWEANIKVYSGEETPPGEDSRLTRALKSYHLQKVSQEGGDSRDLPSWLFSAQERELGQRRTRTRNAEIPPAETPPARSRRSPVELPPVRERRFPESSSTSSIMNNDTNHSSSALSTRGSNDPNRLRRLREAKRQAEAVPQSEPPVAYSAPKQRVGLPTGPGSARLRPRQNF